MSDEMIAEVDLEVSGDEVCQYFHLQTDEAREWVQKHIVAHNDPMDVTWMGEDVLVVGYGYATPILVGMYEDGLTLPQHVLDTLYEEE